MTDLSAFMPRHKFDFDAVAEAQKIGFPALSPIIPDLLKWTQDENWPIAGDVADLLVTAGPELVPHVEQILGGDDALWKYFLLGLVVERLPDPLWGILDKRTIEKLVRNPNVEERENDVDKEAVRVLSMRGHMIG